MRFNNIVYILITGLIYNKCKIYETDTTLIFVKNTPVKRKLNIN